MDISPEIEEMIRSGNTISAIKELRIQRNLSLEEAKHLVDDWIEQNTPNLRDDLRRARMKS